MNYIELKAPAKINIGLYITSKRDDGYHNLYTLFYPVYGLYDLLKFSKSNKLFFSSNNPDVRFDESNLIIKAVRLLEKTTGKKLDVAIDCEKRIPIGAGLGGGSSDAAATLVSLNELYSLKLNYEKLLELALILGSDVPFFLKAKPAIGNSRGEKLIQIDLFINKYLVIVNPGIFVSTKVAFQNITPQGTELNYDSLLKTDDFIKTHGADLKNDFEEYVFSTYPETSDIKEKLLSTGAIFSQMSGSGSTVYAFFDSPPEEKKIKELFPSHYLVEVVPPADGYH